MKFESQMFFVQLAYGIPSVLLYMAITVLLHRDRLHFNSVYYSIMKFSMMVDISSYVVNTITLRIIVFDELAPFFARIQDNYSYVPFYMSWLMFGCLQLQNLRCVVGSLHRFMVVKSPIDGDKYWEPKMPFIFVILPFLAALISGYVPYVNPSLSINIWSSETRWHYQRYNVLIPILLGTALLFFIVCGGLNIGTVYLLRKHRARCGAVKRLVQMSALVALLQSINLTMLVFKEASILGDLGYELVMERNVLPYTLDMYCLAPPWIQLCMNKEIRERLLRSFGAKYKESTLTATQS